MKNKKIFTVFFMITTITSIIKADSYELIETVEGYIRTGYQYTDVKNDAAYTDLALGGKLHIETSSWQHMNAGVSLYTTNVLGSNNGGNGIPFFNLHNNSYAIIGEAYLKGEWDQTMLKIGRQEIDTPYADTDDIGMIPNTFEAAILVNKSVPDTTILLAQLQTMTGVDAENPSSFTKLNGKNGVQTAGISYEGIENISISGWYYRLHDFEIDQIVYAEAIYEANIGDIGYMVGIQFASQSYSLQNNTVIWGLQGVLTHETSGLSLGIAYNQNGGNSASNGFGGGPYFSSSEHLTLAEAGTRGKATLLSAGWETANIGLPELTLGAGYLILEDQNDAKAKELDLTLHYEYTDSLSFDFIYSDIRDKINGGAFNNIRFFTNYSF